MANTKFTKPVDTTDMPPEFNDTEHPQGAFPASAGLSRDALKGMAFDSAKHNEAYQKMQNPKGDWTRSDRWEFDEAKHVQVRTDDSQPGDINPTGRVVFNFAGFPDKRTVGGIDYRPMFFVRMSPDVRYNTREGKENEFDLSHKLFLEAREIYLAIHGEELTTADQLIYLMTEDKIILNTMNGDSGPLVLHIKAPLDVRQRRQNARSNS